jgi:Transposase IS66 family
MLRRVAIPNRTLIACRSKLRCHWRPASARPAIPEQRSASILARLDDRLVDHRARTSAKSPLGEALAYTAKYRNYFGRFLTDGRV